MARVHYWELSNYNGGNLIGKWFDLDGVSHDEHLQEIQEWLDELTEEHKADDPDMYDYEEVIIGDVEDVPSDMRSEWSIYESFFDLQEAITNSYLDDEVFHAGIALGIPADKIEDAYYGSFKDDTDLAYEYVEAAGLLCDVPSSVKYYFDYEAFGRDKAINDFMEHDGHYFHNHWQ